jgi:hypothetical protein
MGQPEVVSSKAGSPTSLVFFPHWFDGRLSKLFSKCQKCGCYRAYQPQGNAHGSGISDSFTCHKFTDLAVVEVHKIEVDVSAWGIEKVESSDEASLVRINHPVEVLCRSAKAVHRVMARLLG